MPDVSILKMAWALLSPRERRNAWIVLAVVSVAALSAAFMVGSVLPFLTVLADTSRIHDTPPLAWAYETFGFDSDYAFLVALGLLTLAVVLGSNALQLMRTYVVIRYAQMRIYTLSRKLLGLYLDQPYEFFLNRHSGDMSTRVLSEVDQTVNGFFKPVAEFVSAVLTITALITLLVWINPAVAIGVFLVFGGTYGAIYFIVRQRISKLGKDRFAANSARFLAAKEVLGGIKAVKLHGNETIYLERYGDACFRAMRSRVVSSLISQLPHYFIQSLALGGVVVLCLVIIDPAAFNSGDGSTLADLLPLIGVIAFAGQRMMPELSKLYGSLTAMRFGAASVEALFADVDAARHPSETIVAASTQPLRLRENLRLEKVTYSYPNADKSSLHETSLTIRSGERIGIVGGTGAGKTTIADLILGLLDPSSGRITADGVEIDDTTRRQWQKSLAYVPQEIFLVDASIYENIAFGVPANKLDRARVEDAARIAQLDNFVRNELSDGYDTLTGERGVRLSGGQRQRIGIARALYHNADLIVFDEATSALDNLTEREVMAAIDATPGDKTIMMIAHRLSTVKSCDRIIVLDKGAIVAAGTWDELMEDSVTFRALAAA